MGCGASAPREYPVLIHVYRLLRDDGTSVLRQAATSAESAGYGIFHTGVEIGGVEYSYGRVEKQRDENMRVVNGHVSGVWTQRPKVLPRSFEGAQFKESVQAGVVTMQPSALRALISRLSREWRGTEYDAMRHNCNHSSAALCRELGVAPPPDYVNRLANTGAGIAGAARSVMSSMLTAGAGMLGGMLAQAERELERQQQQQQGQQGQQGQQQQGQGQPQVPVTGVPVTSGTQPVMGVPVQGNVVA